MYCARLNDAAAVAPLTILLPPSAVLMLLRKIPAMEKIHVAYNTWDQRLAADEIVCVAGMMLYRAERLVINESMPDLKEIELPDLSL